MALYSPFIFASKVAKFGVSGVNDTVEIENEVETTAHFVYA
jgi:hypothetical protein